MSRIIVKGLPVYLTDEKLKQHFFNRVAQQHKDDRSGVDWITDVKIVRDRDGKSRRFAFLGYRNEEDAFDAVEYFNSSYIDTAKIEVSMAKSFADPRVPKSMKEKRREAYQRLREREERLQRDEKPLKNAKHVGIEEQISKDQQLQEFIETMKPSSQVASWEKVVFNVKDSTTPVQETPENTSGGNSLLAHALALRKDGTSVDSDDEYVDIQQQDEKKEEEEEEEHEPMLKLDEIPEDKSVAELAQNEQVSDLEWLKQRQVRIREGADAPVVPDKQAAEPEKEAFPEEQDGITQEEAAIQKIQATGRLFLRNILYSSTEDDFRQLFSPYGALEEVHVALDTRTGKSKGFAYILFKDPQDAVKTYIELDKQIFQGRLLHILPGEARKSHRLDEFDIKNMPLKKQRELKRKSAATKQTFSWNSLYMNQDAVLSSVAAKLGMEKSQLLDAENSSSAVKQALAEAHVIGDVRTYFESKGVDLTKFGQIKSASQRDERVILVKNFSYGTTREELAELFLPFGKLERLLMPPAGTIAIVQYRDVTAARSAFTKLAYKKFKDGILYLEKGPKNCFTGAAKADDLVDVNLEERNIVEIQGEKPDIDELLAGKGSEAEDTESEAHQGPTVSIFIKNLNFSTSNEEVTNRFRVFDGFVVAQVKTKSDPKKPGKTLSMGFGFAEFRSKAQAEAAIAALDGSVIDGHRIQLKLSHRQAASTGAKRSKKSERSSKIIVKNLPFEATRKDVFELFSSFGQLKSVRVPKKFDKSARGFAFVEFLLPKEAENAMDQLQGVHLLGRRLVMQYAEQEAVDAEEEIARMTKKVKKQMVSREFGTLKSSGGRKKLEMDEEEE